MDTLQTVLFESLLKELNLIKDRRISREEKAATADTIAAYVHLVRSAGLESIVAPKLVTVERILRLVRGLQDKSGSVMTALYRIADTGAEAAEFILRDITPHLGEPLMNLPLRKGFLIAALLHEEKVIIPSGQTVLSAGDRVIVISHGKSLLAFKDIFEDTKDR